MAKTSSRLSSPISTSISSVLTVSDTVSKSSRKLVSESVLSVFEETCDSSNEVRISSSSLTVAIHTPSKSSFFSSAFAATSFPFPIFPFALVLYPRNLLLVTNNLSQNVQPSYSYNIFLSWHSSILHHPFFLFPKTDRLQKPHPDLPF